MTEQVLAASELLWSSDFTGAESILQNLLNEDETNLEVNLKYSQIAWLRAVLSEQDDHATEAYSRIQNCRKLCGNSSDYYILSVKAESNLMESLLLLRLGSYISGAFKLRKGWLQFQSLAGNKYENEFKNASKDTQQRILFVIAAFNFFVSIIPPALLFIVSALGFEANRQQGYEQLQESFRSKTSISPLAGKFFHFF